MKILINSILLLSALLYGVSGDEVSPLPNRKLLSPPPGPPPGTRHGKAAGNPNDNCLEMEIQYNSEFHDLMDLDIIAIEEYVCNDMQRKLIVDFLNSLDASTMDECEEEIYGPLLMDRDEVLEMLQSEGSCIEEVDNEVVVNHDRKLGLSSLGDAYEFAYLLAAAATTGCYGGDTKCLAGVSCNKCCNGYDWRWSDFTYFCK
jgi:hypothetical protein